MKITSFYPSIITEKSEDAIKLFEELGFERRHRQTGINDEDITSVTMKDANGFRVNVTQMDHATQDIVAIHINVDDFDEAYELLTAHGFKNAQGEKLTETGSARATMMVSPSGYAINLVKHIKK